jgi:alpha-galactosidase
MSVRKMKTMKWISSCALLALLPFGACGQIKRDGLAATPPMGWNSWNKFQCHVSEDLVKSVADALVTSGMKDAGYTYVVIDDCWQVSRDESGNILADAKLFPSGIKALADYVHAKGLKFGIYSDAGTQTCGGRPASQGHEFQDARSYASWGVDYLKYDWCNTGTRNAEEAYATMNAALLETGRPIVFSICEWGTAKPWLWAKGIGNLWRTTGDIHDCWDCKTEYESGLVLLLDKNAALESFAGPGHWNDPDMLEVGNGGMTTAEYQAHFSLWAMLAAPLMAGNDIRSMSSETREILTNAEVIAVDQDAFGQQGRRIQKNGEQEIWSRPLADGGRAVILFNRGSEPAVMSVNWELIGYPGHVAAKVRDLWKHQDLGSFHDRYTGTVGPRSVIMLKILP